MTLIRMRRLESVWRLLSRIYVLRIRMTNTKSPSAEYARCGERIRRCMQVEEPMRAGRNVRAASRCRNLSLEFRFSPRTKRSGRSRPAGVELSAVHGWRRISRGRRSLRSNHTDGSIAARVRTEVSSVTATGRADSIGIDVDGRRADYWRSRSRSSVRRIFPVSVRGSVSMNSTARGYLYGASVFLTWF